MIRKLAKPVAATALAIGIAAVTAVPASATDNIQKFGVRETMNDFFNGAPTIGYTVNGLSPSSDAIPHNGQLYESTVSVDAFNGWATPMISMFNARAENGQMHRVLTNVAAPQALNGAAVPPGGNSTGKIYFDVVGDAPNSVVYNDGVRDILAWVP